jgi:hypothetical protein
VYDNAQRLQPTTLPTEIHYAILFHDNASANGNTLHYIVSQIHHRWHTSNSYLFLTDGVTVPSHSPFPYTRKTYISRQQTNMAASRLAARPGDARSATLFLGRGPPKHTVGLSIPTAQKYIRRGAHPSLSHHMDICRTPTLGTPWSHCQPQPKGSSEAKAHPQQPASTPSILGPILTELVL